MTKARLEAFSDGVLAIIITIMVLELKAPHNNSLSALFALWPLFLSYVLSFIYVAIYWNNHHMLFHATQKISGTILWQNAHLLFWLSLIPFTTAWMGENHFTKFPVAVYGFVLLMCAVAYYLLAHSLNHLHGKDSAFSKALKDDRKGKVSILLYTAGVALSLLQPIIGFIIYCIVAVIWFVPDQRFVKNETSA